MSINQHQMTSGQAGDAPKMEISSIAGSGIYEFRGGAVTWFGTQLLGALFTVCTLGIYTFWGYPRLMQWKVEKTVYA